MEGVCFASRVMRLDLPERLPSLSEYLCGDDFPSPQLRDDDDDGSLMVALTTRDYPSSQTDCFLSEYGSRQESLENIYEEEEQRWREDARVRTWISLDAKPPAVAVAAAAASNPPPPTQTASDFCFRFEPEPEVASFPVTWGQQFPAQQIQANNPLACYSTSSTSFLPRLPCVDVTSSSVAWSKPEVTERTSNMSPSSSSLSSNSSSTSSSRKRAHRHPPPAATVDAKGGGLLDDAEARKLELKRAKNREAAQRCQQRKQERIVRLEGKVSRLREQNVALNHTVTALREQVGWLRRQVASHVHNGCQIALPPFNPV